MATPPSASRFAQILRDEGVTVVEVGDWETHNRNHKGPWGPVHGVMIHHTATSGARRTVSLCRDGYSSLLGPLCHGVITKDGRVHLVGYGRANHAGSGDGDVLRAVINETALPADNEADTDGNRYFYGFECENLGDGQDPWPTAQVEAIVRVSAAICRVHDWTARSTIGHLEWQPGKSDPRPSPGGADVSMPALRARVAERLQYEPDWNPKEEPVALTTDEIKQIANTAAEQVWKYPVEKLNTDTNWSTASQLRAPHIVLDRIETTLAAQAQAIADLTAKVEEIKTIVSGSTS